MVTDTSKSLRFQKTQMFSQMIDQKEHKNNRYKFEPATWCYKHHSSRHEPASGKHLKSKQSDIFNCKQPSEAGTIVRVARRQKMYVGQADKKTA